MIVREQLNRLRLQGQIKETNSRKKGQTRAGLQSSTQSSIKISVILVSPQTQFSFDYAFNYKLELRISYVGLNKRKNAPLSLSSDSRCRDGFDYYSTLHGDILSLLSSR